MKPKDVIYFGLGAILLTKDKMEEKVKKMCEKGKDEKSEFERFSREARERADKEIKRIEEGLGARIKEEVDRLGLATKDDLEELKARFKKT